MDERNWLMQYSLPRLQRFAVTKDMQLQLVDLRWGASRDVATDPDCQPVFLQQIDYCRQYSTGPFFAVRILESTARRGRLGLSLARWACWSAWQVGRQPVTSNVEVGQTTYLV